MIRYCVVFSVLKIFNALVICSMNYRQFAALTISLNFGVKSDKEFRPKILKNRMRTTLYAVKGVRRISSDYLL